MKARSQGTKPEDRPPHGRPRAIRLGAHQTLEYLLAALLVLNALRLPGRQLGPVLGAGLALLALAALTEGPLAALRWLSPRAHAAADVLLAGALAVAPFALGVHDEPRAAVPMWATAAFLVFLAASTDYRPRTRTRARRASLPPPPPRPVEGSATLNAAARAAGAGAGALARSGPRRLGRAVGRYRSRRRP